MAITPTFPLTVHGSGRYLVDAAGNPFHMRMDSVWSAIVNLTTAQRDAYLDDRVSKRFSAILTQLTDKHFTALKPPKDQAGNLPWTKRLDGATYTGTPNGTTSANGNTGQFSADNYSSISTEAPDFTNPNATYFANATSFVAACAARGLLVVLFPCFIGFNLSDHGWMLELEQNFLITGWGGLSGQSFANNTKTKAWNYGAYIGDLFKTYKNILWANAGDFGPDLGSGLAITAQQLNAVNDLMQGIKSVGAGTSLLHTAEWSRWNAGSIGQDETLTSAFDLSACYVNSTPAVEVYRAIATGKPPHIIENPYENITTIATTTLTAPYRKYFWWGAALGAGICYGNDDGVSTALWKFAANYDTTSPGFRTQAQLDAARANTFFDELNWSSLIASTTIITSGGNTTADQTYVAASVNAAGSLMIAYLPPDHTGSITVDTSGLKGRLRGRWWDPTNGTYQATSGSPYGYAQSRTFTTPGNNAGGDADWVLVLDTDPAMSISKWVPANSSTVRR